MEMIEFVFAQYSVGMGVRLNLDITGTPAGNPLSVDLPFLCCLFHIMSDSPASITRAVESLTG